MSNSVNLSLDVTKTGIQNPLVKVRQGDGGFETLRTTVTANGEPMDLQGWIITFMGTTAGNHKIVDTNVKLVEASNGIFDYTPSKAWGMDVGEFKVAYFKFVKGDGVASSANFRVNVIEAVDLTQEEAQNYISVVDATIAEVNNRMNAISNNVTTLGNRINDYNNKLAAVKVGGRNYILNSGFSTSVDVPVLHQSVDYSFYSNKQVTASVYVKYNNVKTMEAVADAFRRVVFAVSFRDASGKMRYLDAAKVITSIGESFAGRVSQTMDLSGFNVASMPTIAVFIQNFTADYVEASNPKLEIGNVATDWTPAPEDIENAYVKKSGDTMTGSLQVGGNAREGKSGTVVNGSGSIELASSTAYIDFHGGNDTGDYSSRMYDSGDGLGTKIVNKSGFGVISAPLITSATNKYNLDTVAYGSSVLTMYSHKAIVSARTNLLGTSPYTTGDGVTNVLDNVVITWERGATETFGVQTITNLWDMMAWQRVRRNGVWQPWVKIADDNNVVHKTGNETIAGDKTFTGNTTLSTTTLLAGNYGLRVTASGIQKTTDGKTWVPANI